MCGRFSLTHPHQLELRFDVSAGELLEARYNVAPTQQIPVIVDGPTGRMLRSMRWGFQPAWAASDRTRPAPINARAETVAEKPLFRRALSYNRCLIPADGFFEWQAIAGQRTKQPFHIRLRDGALFGFAGLYTEQEGQGTVAILTTAPNAVVAPIHTRMPVILGTDDEGLWLDHDVTSAAPLQHLLRPYQASLMEAYPVASLVSSVRNDGPDIVRPLVSASRLL